MVALPAWDNDPLSMFPSGAQQNERVTSLKMADIYTVLQRAHGDFLRGQEITERDNDANMLPTRFLMARAHSAWLAAVRLGLSAQAVEVYPLLRATNRERSLDTATEKAVHQLYEWTIDLGGHPNERGVMTTTIRTDAGFGAVFLSNNPVPIAGALKVAAEVAVGTLKTLGLVYPERFAIMGVDRDIAELVDGINTAFKTYIPDKVKGTNSPGTEASGGCLTTGGRGGPQSPKSTRLTFEVDVV